MKKLLLLSFLTLSMFFVFEAKPQAATMYQGYSITLNKQQKNKAVEGTTIPTVSYRFALNNITASSGKAAIHTALATKYQNKWQTTSAYVKFEGAGRTGNILFRGVMDATTPSSFSYNLLTHCNGKNVGDYACIIKGSQYGLSFSNENWLNSFTSKGNLVFTD